MIVIDGIEYENIDDYINTNERYEIDDVICPYCYYEQEDIPEIAYHENDNVVYECQNCGKKFLINTGVYYHHTITPIKEEIEKFYDIKEVEE